MCIIYYIPDNFKKQELIIREGKNMTSKKANFEINLYLVECGVLKWQIADRLGITDSSFSRKLRKELPPEEKQKIRQIIDDLKEGTNN